MASNEFNLSEQSTRNDFDFSLKKIGTFWIMKTPDSAKRLIFLDNAKEVFIDENILVADDQLFEILQDKKGKVSFHKLENITYETDQKRKETDSGQLDKKQCKTEYSDNSTDKLPIQLIQNQSDGTNPTFAERQTDNNRKEEAEGNFKFDEYAMTGQARPSEHSETMNDPASLHESFMSDLYYGSADDAECDVGQIQDKFDSLALGSTEVDSVIKVAQMTTKLPYSHEVPHSRLHQLEDKQPSTSKYAVKPPVPEPRKTKTASQSSLHHLAQASTLASLEPKTLKDTAKPPVPEPRKEIIGQDIKVEVLPCDLVKLCGIEGKMTLLVGNNALAFEDPKIKKVKYIFPLNWIRRFGTDGSELFFFEVGRNCPNGDGSVRCTTPGARFIKEILDIKIHQRAIAEAKKFIQQNQ